ncbi:hypothetical protein C8J56DRAFT_267496 [Mycena floridula]|nr:hypothetical protein C8J56DRAFT_267496 [Mycena floridula]
MFIRIFADLMKSVLERLADAGNARKAVHDFGLTKPRRGKTVRWPASPDDLLPYGASQSITALISWIPSYQSSILLALFIILVELCKARVMGPILASPRLAEFAMQFYAVPKTITRENAQPILVDLLRISLFLDSITKLVDKGQLMTFLASSKSFDPKSAAAAAKTVDSQLPVLTRHTSSDYDYNEAFIRQTFLRISSQIHSFYKLPADLNRYGELVVLGAQVMANEDIEKIIGTFEAFTSFAHNNGCFGPGCRETHASAGRKFSKCSGCSRVPYCSSACQTRAWSHSSVPHKAICSTIRTVATVTAIPEKPVHNTDMVPFITKYRSNSMLDPLSIAISTHFRDLTALNAYV